MIAAKPLAWGLAGSLAANLALGAAWLNAHDSAARAGEQRDQARAQASSCSDAVEDLRDLAGKRAKEAKAARDLAARTARQHDAFADAFLAMPPSTPGDDCRSAQDQVRSWLQERRRP